MTVPLATITAQGNGTFDVTARLTDAAGNAGAELDGDPGDGRSWRRRPTVAITAITTDSGTSSSDYVTNDTTLTVSGTHGPLAPGEKVQVSSDGGASWADVTTSTASTWSYTDPTPHATSFTYQARIVDAVGNVGANTASQAVTIDTAAPTAPSITSIAENSGGGINAGEASNGTPVVVGLAGTGAAAGDTLTVNWGGQTVTYTLLAGRHLGQQRDGDGAARDDHGAGPGHVRRDGPADRRGGQCRRQLDGHLGDGRHGGADGDGCDHRHYHRQRHSSSDYVTSDTTLTVSGTHGPLGSGETVQVSSDGGASWADATSTASTWSYTDPDDARHELHLPGADRRRRGQCRCQHRQSGGDHRHGGADGAVDHLDRGEWRRRHQHQRGRERHAGGGGAGGHRGGGRQHADRQLGRQAVTYSLTAGDISANSATVTVPAATITAQGHGTFNVTARLTDAAGNVSANSTATSVTVDTAAPTAPSITSIAENGGGGINAGEASDGTPVVVGLTGTGAAAGDTLTVNWGSQTVTYTLLAADISGSSATVTVPAATITAQGHGTFNVTARLTDAAGNAGANSTATSVTVDTAAPTAPSITSIAENSGGGINAGEAADGTPVVVGLAGTGAAAGDTLTVNWGSQTVTYTLLAGDISASSATVTVPLATIMAQGNGTFNVTARLTDAAGNAGAELDGHPGDGRHGGADGAVDHLDRRERWRRHQRRRGLERHAGGGRA